MAPSPLKILLAFADPYYRNDIAELFEKHGCAPEAFDNGDDVYEAAQDGSWDLLVCDTLLHGTGGRQLVRQLLADLPGFPMIVLTSQPRVDEAFELGKLGLSGYMTQGDDEDAFLALAKRVASGQPETTDEKDGDHYHLGMPYSHYRSRNRETANVFELAVKRVAQAPSTVLITGESGTGKELLAKTIHHFSPRNGKPWVAVNCAALPENLIESELFGHEKGAFTGATSRRIGRFEKANGGTFFLDEIGDLPQTVQIKLLRVLQEKSFERVGGNASIRVDVRIIAATNRNLRLMMKKGRFREDLYYRLRVINLDLPPLRERPEDIPGLARFFLERYRKQNGREAMVITPQALHLIQQYPWPGNVRELENVIERTVVMAPHRRIEIEDLPPEIQELMPRAPFGVTLRDAREQFEEDFITEALEREDGNVSATAKRLGIARKNLQEKINKYEIDVQKIRNGEPEPSEEA